MVASTAASTDSPVMRHISSAVDQHADHQREHGGGRDRDQRMPGEQRRRGRQAVGAEHHQLAVRERQHPADAVDQDIAAADQRIDRRQYRDVDGELHLSASGYRFTSIACQSCTRTTAPLAVSQRHTR